MPKFDEHALEMSIMKLFEKEGYTYVHGDRIQRNNKTQVLIEEDLREYLKTRYVDEGLTKSEIDSIILSLHAISGTLYEDNKQILQKISDGFIFNREDRSKKDIYIELLDYEPDAEKNRNIYKIVNQFEIEGYNNQLRIPDGIVFVNGIPLVVLEFKSAIKENTTIMDAYTQLTVRYQRDIPEIFKYNAFVVICDGANSKYGSLFSSYDFFYAWRKVEDNDPEMDGINSLYTMVNGLFRKDRLLDVVKNFIYPKSAEGVGYILRIDGKRIYIAGDTDATKEAKAVKCDIALVPIGGTYTMDAKKAANLINTIRPDVAIPVHYGHIVGKPGDGEVFAENVMAPIKVEFKIAF